MNPPVSLGQLNSRSLSDQLYESPTHFLFELVQNADDNAFAEDVIPSLAFTLCPAQGNGSFRSDCNEIGFTIDNIYALTRIGQSTKTITTDGQKNHVGEKGIGFKSVFKVADVVRVSSGFYEFKFDRNERIGMISPIICPFPTTYRLDGQTQFLLELSSSEHYDDVAGQLASLRPEFLLFLRRLKQLRISTPGSGSTYLCEKHSSFGEIETEVTELTILDNATGVTQKAKYLMRRHCLQNMPAEPRREGVTASEIVLAFPMDTNFAPVARPQQVFSFLPIEESGLSVSN